MDPISEPPEKSSQEEILNILSLVTKFATAPTIVGPFIIEIFETLWKRPLENRRSEWMTEVANAINEIILKQEKLSPAKLAESPEFVTILHRATEIALRTHQNEKRYLLRNAIVTAGSPLPPHIDKQIFFLRLIDELSINQILVLRLYKNPLEWFQTHDITPNRYASAQRNEVLSQAYPSIGSSRYVKELVLNDLVRRGLLTGLDVMVSSDAIYNPIVSELAIEFIDYVKAEEIEAMPK